MEAKAAATGSLPSSRLTFARVTPGTSALEPTPSVYIFLYSLLLLLTLHVLLEDSCHGVHHL